MDDGLTASYHFSQQDGIRRRKTQYKITVLLYNDTKISPFFWLSSESGKNARVFEHEKDPSRIFLIVPTTTTTTIDHLPSHNKSKNKTKTRTQF